MLLRTINYSMRLYSNSVGEILRKTFMSMRQLRFPQRCAEREADMVAMNKHKWSGDLHHLYEEWIKFYKNYFSYHSVKDIEKIKARGHV